MSEVSPVSLLVRLQRLDDEVFRIQKRLASGPKLVEQRAQKLVAAEAALEAERDQARDQKKSISALELDLQTKEAEIAKLMKQRDEARTNQEYSALGEHADRLKAECSDLEDQILEGFSAIETAEADIAARDAKLDGLRKDIDEFRAAWAKDEAEYQAELEQAQGARDEFSKQVSPGPLSVYNKLLGGRDGEAVVPLEGKVCGGCRMTLTPNDQSRVHSIKEMVCCKSCDRILFVPSVHGRGSA